MKELNVSEVTEVSGGIALLNLGATLVALFIGAMAGPAGLGIALSGIVAAYGINEMEQMGNEQFGQQPNQ
jgi:lactobin A/cerein 7B family class IIb bacteriocin